MYSLPLNLSDPPASASWDYGSALSHQAWSFALLCHVTYQENKGYSLERGSRKEPTDPPWNTWDSTAGKGPRVWEESSWGWGRHLQSGGLPKGSPFGTWHHSSPELRISLRMCVESSPLFSEDSRFCLVWEAWAMMHCAMLPLTAPQWL